MGTIKNIFDVSGRAMAAQMIRLNTVASNLANANNISSTSEGAYRPLKPIFRTIYSDKLHDNGIASVDAINVKELNQFIKIYFNNNFMNKYKSKLTNQNKVLIIRK